MHIIVQIIMFVVIYETLFYLGRRLYGVHPSRMQDFRKAASVGAIAMLFAHTLSLLTAGMIAGG